MSFESLDKNMLLRYCQCTDYYVWLLCLANGRDCFSGYCLGPDSAPVWKLPNAIGSNVHHMNKMLKCSSHWLTAMADLSDMWRHKTAAYLNRYILDCCSFTQISISIVWNIYPIITIMLFQGNYASEQRSLISHVIFAWSSVFSNQVRTISEVIILN